ncbi:hypothetical protein [Roseovarius pacificus]|uniref:hypothetical protein n=1 Tax=Roseovarius pacificus TaxID=337701 RepID=UPI002A18BFE3|nr:hypothetical protein [Roseovarius pacificus]
MNQVSLPEACPRDREVQHVVLQLVEAYAFREAAAILNTRLREIADTRQSHIERVFLDWCNLPEGDRPEFLTYAHHRRRPELENGS